MRFSKILLTFLLTMIAVVGGLFAAAIVAAASLGVVLVRSLSGRKRARIPAANPPPVRAAATGDAIEIAATEVFPAQETGGNPHSELNRS